MHNEGRAKIETEAERTVSTVQWRQSPFCNKTGSNLPNGSIDIISIGINLVIRDHKLWNKKSVSKSAFVLSIVGSSLNICGCCLQWLKVNVPISGKNCLSKDKSTELELKQKFLFSYFRENFRFFATKVAKIMANSYKICEKDGYMFKSVLFRNLKLKFQLFSQLFGYEKRKFSRKAKTKTFRFNSTLNYNKADIYEYQQFDAFRTILQFKL
jgi:hypothetical protein